MVLNVECSLLNTALKMENRRVFQPTLRGRLESNVHIVSPKSQCHFLYSTHGYQNAQFVSLGADCVSSASKYSCVC